ncbi:orotidine 5'-phosphate decarboxylase, partial [Striga asiatica]
MNQNTHKSSIISSFSSPVATETSWSLTIGAIGAPVSSSSADGFESSSSSSSSFFKAVGSVVVAIAVRRRTGRKNCVDSNVACVDADGFTISGKNFIILAWSKSNQNLISSSNAVVKYLNVLLSKALTEDVLWSIYIYILARSKRTRNVGQADHAKCS